MREKTCRNCSAEMLLVAQSAQGEFEDVHYCESCGTMRVFMVRDKKEQWYGHANWTPPDESTEPTETAESRSIGITTWADSSVPTDVQRITHIAQIMSRPLAQSTPGDPTPAIGARAHESDQDAVLGWMNAKYGRGV